MRKNREVKSIKKSIGGYQLEKVDLVAMARKISLVAMIKRTKQRWV